MPNRQLPATLFAALAIIARLPFLVTGKIPFDSDEAVEGLMARHVLEGELPAFFWGQAFKGVPEVYASAAAFALFGPGVAVLKGVTLACFALYVALNFILLDRLTSRWIAASASLLLIFAPPALVFWSLDASAEYIIIMLLGTVLLLQCLRPRSAHAPPSSATFPVGLVVGLGLWVHQLFVVYLIPLAVILAIRSGWWSRLGRPRLNRVALALGAIASVYAVLGIVAFLSGGFSLQLGSLVISVTAPQKMARIAIAVLTLGALVQLAGSTSWADARDAVRHYRAAAAGFLVGYAPVLLYSVLVEPARSPARVANLHQLIAAAPDMLGNIVPILAGFKIPPTADRLPVPLVAVIPGAAALAMYLWRSRRRLSTDFFALFVVFLPLLFLASGAYLDTQSYRYFIPWYAGLCVAWAAGSLALAETVRGEGGRADMAYYVATTIVAAIVAVHAWQQVSWYQKLQPDTHSRATLECLQRNGIRGGYAEYWTAFKLTFLSQEQIIIAPTDGLDRYPRYTEFVRGLPAHQQVRLSAGTTSCEQ